MNNSIILKMDGWMLGKWNEVENTRNSIGAQCLALELEDELFSNINCNYTIYPAQHPLTPTQAHENVNYKQTLLTAFNTP